jgi:uncharacterized membrane protein
MMDKELMAKSAVAGLLSLGLLSAGGALAADDKNMEKCWGISKAGQNDCGSDKTAHSCAGQSKRDYDPNDFKAVKTGTCEKMGGSLVQGKAGKMAMEKKG